MIYWIRTLQITTKGLLELQKNHKATFSIALHYITITKSFNAVAGHWQSDHFLQMYVNFFSKVAAF